MKNKSLMKFLSAFMAVAIVFCSAPLSGFTGIELPDLFSLKSEAATVSGSCGYNVNWSLDTSTGVLDITGTGNMYNYSYLNEDQIPWYSFNGYIKTVNIAYGVTNIGSSAFYDCTNLISIIIPYGVTRIGNNTFRGCDSLASVTIPNTVTSIEEFAFGFCESLTSIEIPDSVTSISDWTFAYCYGLTSVTIPDSATSIGNYAFRECTSLTSVTIPDSVISIGKDAFEECTSLTDVYYMGDVESWCGISFGNACANPMYNSSAKSFYIGEDLLENLIIPSNVTEIKAYAFKGFECLKSVTIPVSVNVIYSYAFNGCKNINCFTYEGSELQWNEILIHNYNDNLLNAEIIFLDGGHEHIYISSVTTKPTCTEEGVKTFKCGCGDTYTESIPATGHTWSKWIVTTEATETADGTKVRICKVCEDAAEIEEIPATGSGSGEEPSGGITITLTDENGNVIIKEIISDYNTDISFENGTYTLTISKENYVSRTYTVTATDNMLSVDFSLNKIGDMNGDGKVNTVDVAKANAHAKGISSLEGYDLACVDINGDGRVNTVDVAKMNAHAKGVITLW